MRLETYLCDSVVIIAVYESCRRRICIKFYHKSTNQIRMTAHKGNLPVVNVIKNLLFLKIAALGRNDLLHV